jgi:glucosamine--fructose-6-phosphate aminotransferase (isomerizing)
MALEIAESAEVSRRLLEAPEPIRQLARSMHGDGARACVTVARGSSDHAAAHFAALMARLTGRFVASMPPSWTTVLRSPWPAGTWRPIVFSQSGRSPDLQAVVEALDPHAHWSAAFVNDPTSSIWPAVSHRIPLLAGPERSVAATKSVVAQMVAGAMLVDACIDAADERSVLQAELPALPGVLEEALASPDWPIDPDWLRVEQVLVIGRGQSLPIAQEIALKLKETCRVHAEAFSSAEVRHGPQAMIDSRYRALILAPDRVAINDLRDTADHLHRLGAMVNVAGSAPWCDVPAIVGPLELCAGLPLLVQAYRWVEALSRARGLDPDRPRHLSKVTLTR